MVVVENTFEGAIMEETCEAIIKEKVEKERIGKHFKCLFFLV
jgi:hypothetical protein